jgi:hypothetical protein
MGRLLTHTLQIPRLWTGDVIRPAAKWDTAAPGMYRVIASLRTGGASAVQQEPIARECVVRWRRAQQQIYAVARASDRCVRSIAPT